MSKIDLAYGRHGLRVELDAAADVIEPRFLSGVADEALTISDVSLNRERAITNLFSGEILASHVAGCIFARQTAPYVAE